MKECGLFIDEYFEAVGKENYMSLMLRQYMTMDIFYCVREFVKYINARTADTASELTNMRGYSGL